MRVLLDTHILIWQIEGDTRLLPEFRSLIADSANDIFISVVSFWEIAIKMSRGKLSLSMPLEEIVRVVRRSTGIILTVEPEHTVKVAQLPYLHNDPFDRMIVSQCLTENISLISMDKTLGDYGVNIL